MNWPKDSMPALLAFYGDPRAVKTRADWESKNLVSFKPPFQMYYDHHALSGFRVHRLCNAAFYAAFNEIWDKCGHDQKAVEKLGAADTGGCYNPRLIRGSNTRWSNHSFGCAIDLSPQTNGFTTIKGKTTLGHIVIDAFKRQGARWGGDYQNSRKDPMHFEFVS